MAQNESKTLPGFFYCPSDVTGLEELTYAQRCELLTNQGNYMIPLWQNDPGMRMDVQCSLDNGRVPTHKLPDAVIPTYGAVPIEFENRSASKALMFPEKNLKEGTYFNRKLSSTEYGFRKVLLIQERLKFTDDKVNNRRRVNNASLATKVLYKRACLSHPELLKYERLQDAMVRMVTRLKNERDSIRREYENNWISETLPILGVDN